MLQQLKKLNHIFICPNCKGNIRQSKNTIICIICKKKYVIKNGIPLLFEHETNQDDNITKKIKLFYEHTPFPNYNGHEDVSLLIKLAEKSIFAKLLNAQIPYNAKVLEVGCGTGQLSNYLSTVQRDIVGVDMSFNSLLLAHQFKENNNLSNVGFYQMNIFKPCFKKNSFDYVISNGVLHHTKNPYVAFQTIASLVKKNGYIIIGLYNKYARLLTDARRHLFNIFGNNLNFLDENLKSTNIGKSKKNAWFLDQYKNPHESKHTISEVLEWFEKNNFEFISSVPSVHINNQMTQQTVLFNKTSVTTRTEILLVQLLQILPGAKEGGLFIMIGRKL